MPFADESLVATVAATLPVGARTSNVHIRVYGSANACFARLFRDHLRDSAVARQAWGAFNPPRWS